MKLQPSRFDAVVEALVAEWEGSGRLPRDAGIAVAVVHEGEVVVRRTQGLRDRARRLAVTPSTAFDVGSLTKSLTATALVKAHHQRRLDLDEPLRLRGLIDLPACPEATLADVLAHRTAVSSHDWLWYFGDLSSRELAARARHLEIVPPGFREVFVYNNVLYGCTRVLFEDVLGRSWERHLGEELLAPLGMTSTVLGDDVVGDEALPYAAGEPVERIVAPGIAPAGGARSTIDDLARWALFQLRANGSDAAVQGTHTPRISASAINPMLLAGLEWLGAPEYGYGWFLGSAGGRRSVHHMGFIDGFSSQMLIFPELSLGFVVLVNENMSAFPGRLVQHLFAAAVGETVPPDAPTASPPPPADAPSFVAAPAGVEGRYEHPAYGALGIEAAPEGLRLVYGRHAWPLAFVSAEQAVFVVRAFGMQLPLPVILEAERVRIPLSLDPRLPLQVFERRSGSAR